MENVVVHLFSRKTTNSVRSDIYSTDRNSISTTKRYSPFIYLFLLKWRWPCWLVLSPCSVISMQAVRQFVLRSILTGNYSETVNDAKATIQLQPSFSKAFVRGKSESFLYLYESGKPLMQALNPCGFEPNNVSVSYKSVNQ